MIRFLLRGAALFLPAAGFVALMLDGTRSIATKRLAILDVSELGTLLAPHAMSGLQPWVEKLHPWAWDPVLLAALRVPACLGLTIVGCLLLSIARPPKPGIGYSSRS
jgi:hypothetical protein